MKVIFYNFTNNGTLETSTSDIGSYVHDYHLLQHHTSVRKFNVTKPMQLFETQTEHKFLNCNFITWNYRELHGLHIGLGNKMFIYAALYGLAKYNNKIPYIVEYNSELDKIFKITIQPQKMSEEPKVCQKSEYKCCSFDSSTLKLPCDKSVRIIGYRQSWKYFGHYIEEIKNEFQFVKKVEDKCIEKLSHIKISLQCYSNCITIGVHLRRGDFAAPTSMAFGYIPANKKYLRDAVNYFDKKFKNQTIVYILMGSEPKWNYFVSKNITDNKIFIEKNETASVDLCILTKCDHMIMSSGTFGWWGGFLNNGTVIYMKDQCKPKSDLCSQFELNDYINPDWHWIPL